MTKKQPAELQPEFIKTAAVRRMLGGISRDTLRQLVANGQIPAPIRLSPRLKLYDAQQLIAHLRAAQQRGGGLAA